MAEYDLGRYGAEIVLDTTQFEQGMSQAESQMNNADNKTKNFAGSIGKLAGGAILGLGTALVGAGIAGVKMASDLQSSLNKLQQQTGLTDQQMQGLDESIKNIYNANLGENFEDIANAMANVQQNTGFVGAELEKATKNALLMSETFDMDVNESTRAVKAMMENFGVSADEAYNLIAQGAQNGANKNGDLLDTFNEYSPAMKALGFDAEQFTNILIDGAENGAFSIDKVGDAMKEFNIRAKDGSKASAEGFAILGLNAEEMTSKFAQGGESAQSAFQQVVQELTKIEDPVKKNAAAVALFGTMAEDLEIEAIESFANIGDTASLSSDALEKINEIKFESFGEAVQGIYRNLKTAFLEPFENYVLPILSQFATFIYTNMPQIQQTMSNAISNVSTVISGFVGSIKTMFNGEGNIGSIFTNAFQSIKDVAIPLLQTVVSFIKAQLDEIMVFWKDNGTQILEAVTNIFNGIKAVIEFVMPAVKFIIEMVWTAIKQVITGALDVIMGAVKIFSGLFTGDFSKMWEGVKQLFFGAIDLIIGWMSLTFVGGLRTLITNFAKTAINLVKGMWDDIVKLFTNLGSKVSSVASNMVNAVLGFFRNLYTNIVSTFNNISSSASNVWNSIMQFITGIARSIFNAVKQAFTDMLTAIRNSMSNIKETITTIWNAAMQFFKGIPAQMVQIGKDIITGLINGIGSMASELWNKAKSVVSGMIGATKKELDSHSPSRVYMTIGRDTIDGLIIGIQEKIPEVENAMKGIIDKLTEKAPELVSVAKSLGQTFSKVFSNNIEYANDYVASTALPGSSSNTLVKGDDGKYYTWEDYNEKFQSGSKSSGSSSKKNKTIGDVVKDTVDKVKDSLGKIFKFHDGGWVGLKSNEVPSVLEKGEFVLSRAMISDLSNYNRQQNALPQAINNNETINYNLHNVTIKADNPQQLLQGLEFAIRSNR